MRFLGFQCTHDFFIEQKKTTKMKRKQKNNEKMKN